MFCLSFNFTFIRPIWCKHSNAYGIDRFLVLSHFVSFWWIRIAPLDCVWEKPYGGTLSLKFVTNSQFKNSFNFSCHLNVICVQFCVFVTSYHLVKDKWCKCWIISILETENGFEWGTHAHTHTNYAVIWNVLTKFAHKRNKLWTIHVISKRRITTSKYFSACGSHL